MLSVEERIAELRRQEIDLIKSKLTNIVDYYDKVLGYYDSFQSRLDAEAGVNEASGIKQNIGDLFNEFKAQMEQLNVAKDFQFEYSTGIKLDDSVTSDTVRAEMAKSNKKLSDTEYVEGLRKSDAEYQRRQDEYDSYQKQIAEDKQRKKDLDAAIKKTKDKGEKERLKAERDAVDASIKENQKAAKAIKLKSKDLKNWEGIQQQLQSVQEAFGNAAVDSAVAQSASYKRILSEYSRLQNQSDRKDKDEKLFRMYGDEINAINEKVRGLSEAEISDYINNYEKWWKLNEKKKKNGKLSASDEKKYNQYSEVLEGYNKKSQAFVADQQKRLADELLEEMYKMGKEVNSTQGLSRQAEELSATYNKKIQEVEESYFSTNAYKKLVEKLEKEKKKKKPNTDTIKKYEEQLQALKRGGTLSNINQYLDIFEWVQKRRDKYKAGKLSKSEAKKYDEYIAKLDAWDKEKQRQIDDLRKELEDKLKEAEIEFNTQNEQNKEKLLEIKKQMWEKAKTIAEFQVQSLQSEIDRLNEQVSKYNSIVNLLQDNSLEGIRKYDIGNLLGFNDDDRDVSEIIREKLEGTMDSYQEQLKKLSTQYNAYKDLIDAAGAATSAADFSKIFEQAKKQFPELASTIDGYIKFMNDNNWADGNAWIAEWESMLDQIEAQYSDIIGSIQEVKKQIREQVYFKAIDNAIASIETLNSKLSSMAETISDEWVRDLNGITMFGYAKINSLASEYRNLQNKADEYAKRIAAIKKAREDDLYDDLNEYQKELNEAEANYYSNISNIESVMNEIYAIGKQAQEEQINRIKETIQLQKDALASKKEYYEYDKTVRDQSKNVAKLEAQIAALEGIDTAESKAKIAQLQSDLQDAKDQLKDTKTEHMFELEEKALDEFIVNLDKTLDDTTKTVSETFEEFINSVQKLIGTAGSIDTSSVWTHLYGTLLGVKGVIENDETDTAVTEIGETLIDMEEESAIANAPIAEMSAAVTKYLPITVDCISETNKEIGTVIDLLNAMNTTPVSSNTMPVQTSQLVDITSRQLQLLEAIARKKSYFEDNKTSIQVNFSPVFTNQYDYAKHKYYADDLYDSFKKRFYNDLRRAGFNVPYI
jgi:DNA repair exonuclease SbcCD ATPase subunit